MRVVIVPGNGCTDCVRNANFYGWLEKRLDSLGIFDGIIVPDPVMPDPDDAKESIWVPHVRDKLLGGECSDAVIVGHSSGAVCAMRLAETSQVCGLVLISACHTDLGDAGERAAGYYDRPWEWEAIKSNVGSAGIAVFHSDDDPFIPLHEAQHVAKCLDAEFYNLEARSHFFKPPVEEVVNHLVRRQGGPRALPSNAQLYKGLTDDGRVRVLGLGSLLSEKSARTTFPDLANFEYVRVPGWRRVFAHAAPIFFERGIAKPETKEFASLSAEPVSKADKHNQGFIACCFDVAASCETAWAAFEKREEEFDLVWAQFAPGKAGVLCARGGDDLFESRWGKQASQERLDKMRPHANTVFGFEPDSGLLPCPVYLRHCVLAATGAGQTVLDSFLDETYLVDRKTTLRTYLAANPQVMANGPPESLRERYSG